MHKQFFYQPFLKLDQNENFGFENFMQLKYDLYFYACRQVLEKSTLLLLLFLG